MNPAEIVSERSAPDPGPFQRVGLRDNFYQTAAFLPMSFALVTTVNDNGETGIGPHALCYPFSVTPPYSMLLISRASSGTAVNIRRTGRCALNYIEFDDGRLQAIAALGYPGQDMSAKRKANPFTLVPSPTQAADADPLGPLIVGEAFQVIECTWNDAIDLGDPGPAASGASRFVLDIDAILLRERFRKDAAVGSNFPSMPIFFGFRADGAFWFASHAQPFPVTPPAIPNMELQAVRYLATRLDETVRFTDDACLQLARVPRPFLAEAMMKAIAAAREGGRTLIDAGFLRHLGGGAGDRTARN